MSSANVKTREQLLKEAADLAQQMQDEQDARIESVKTQVEQLKSEGVPIKLLIEGRRGRPVQKEGTPIRGRAPARYRSTVSEDTWSGFGPPPWWFKSGNYTEITSEAAE